MGLAQPKTSGKKIANAWQARRNREKMLNTSITSAPSLAIGMKLMEKMGWKDGQGLGASEQGIIEPIKLKQTINQKGLGYTNVTGLEQMHYSAHFERFESVLASLGSKEETAPEPNNDKTTDRTETKKSKKETKLKSSASKSASSESDDSTSCSSDEGSSSEEGPVLLKKNIKQSLESLSRNVRGRVHYQKFTRGKDVSRYSENDLACILGAKAHTLYTANVKEKGEGGKFVFGALDSKEYFSRQSSALCTPSESRSASDTDEPKTFTPSYPLNALSDNEEEASRPSFGGLGFGATANSCGDVEESDRPAFGGVECDDAAQKCFQDRFAAKYMSAFVKADVLTGTLTTEGEEKANNSEDSSNDGAIVDLESAKTEQKEPETEGKKKLKKNKGHVSDVSQSELLDDPLPKKKKKKSKKEKVINEECCIVASEEECCEVEREDAPVNVKKKKKSKIEGDMTECSINEKNVELESKTEKKKKKKRKREDACEVSNVCNEMQNETTAQDGVPSNDDLLAPKKKKSKRKNKSVDELVEDEPDTLIESSVVEACQTDYTNSERKKKKKKKGSS